MIPSVVPPSLVAGPTAMLSALKRWWRRLARTDDPELPTPGSEGWTGTADEAKSDRPAGPGAEGQAVTGDGDIAPGTPADR